MNKNEIGSSLCEEGLIENIYNLLWQYNPVIDEGIQNLRIPDTVVFQYGKPLSWFFMSKTSKRLKKKMKRHLELPSIIEKFKKHVPSCGIAAVFFEKKSVSNRKQKHDIKDVIVHYLTANEIESFFMKLNQIPNGILQQFIQPHGEANHSLVAYWQPYFCLFELYVNKKNINNFKVDLYERAMTIESMEYHTVKRPLRGLVTPNLVEKICVDISKHLQDISLNNFFLENMTLVFKIDDQGAIWFQNCVNIMLTSKVSIENKAIRNKVQFKHFSLLYKPPDYILENQMTIGKNHDFKKNTICRSCQQNFTSARSYEIDYETILKSFTNMCLYNVSIEKEAEDKAAGQNKKKFAKVLIPPLILRLHPRIKDREFLLLKNNQAFLKNVALVCEDCYLNITKFVQAGGNKEFIKIQSNISSKDLKGTGPLNPSKSKISSIINHKFFEKLINKDLIRKPIFLQKILPKGDKIKPPHRDLSLKSRHAKLLLVSKRRCNSTFNILTQRTQEQDQNHHQTFGEESCQKESSRISSTQLSKEIFDKNPVIISRTSTPVRKTSETLIKTSTGFTAKLPKAKYLLFKQDNYRLQSNSKENNSLLNSNTTQLNTIESTYRNLSISHSRTKSTSSFHIKKQI